MSAITCRSSGSHSSPGPLGPGATGGGTGAHKSPTHEGGVQPPADKKVAGPAEPGGPAGPEAADWY